MSRPATERRTTVWTGMFDNPWILVAPDGVRADDDLDAWVARGVTFARSLPPKE